MKDVVSGTISNPSHGNKSRNTIPEWLKSKSRCGQVGMRCLWSRFTAATRYYWVTSTRSKSVPERHRENNACVRCLFKKEGEGEEESCIKKWMSEAATADTTGLTLFHKYESIDLLHSECRTVVFEGHADLKKNHTTCHQRRACLLLGASSFKATVRHSWRSKAKRAFRSAWLFEA